MRKVCILVLVLLAFVARVAVADTIHLKNGSILKGKVASFADDQFVVMLDTGSGRYLSRAMVYIGDVARIEFDGAPNASAEPTSRETTSPLRSNDSARVTVSPDIPRTTSQASLSETLSQPRLSRASPKRSLRPSKSLTRSLFQLLPLRRRLPIRSARSLTARRASQPGPSGQRRLMWSESATGPARD